MDINGKCAIVTGASRGIGKAIALKLASYGTDIVLNYTSNIEKAIETQKEIEKLGVKCLIVKANVSAYDEVSKMVEDAIETFGKIDILVNNAGITKDMLLLKMNTEDFEKVLDVNLTGTFNCIKAVSKPMIKNRSGKIVNISSVVGIMGNAGQANYAASKAGVLGLTKSIAKELSSRNINVNAVAPGYIETEMTEKLSEEALKAFLSTIPFKKAGKAEDVANLVAFLCSNMSDYITGQVINVDGGMLM